MYAQLCLKTGVVHDPCVIAWLLRPVWGAEAIYAAELLANLAGGVLAAAVAWHLLKRVPHG